MTRFQRNKVVSLAGATSVLFCSAEVVPDMVGEIYQDPFSKDEVFIKILSVGLVPSNQNSGFLSILNLSVMTTAQSFIY